MKHKEWVTLRRDAAAARRLLRMMEALRGPPADGSMASWLARVIDESPRAGGRKRAKPNAAKVRNVLGQL